MSAQPGSGKGHVRRDHAEGQTARLMAEVWYAQIPELADPALLAALRSVSAETEVQEQSLTVPHTDLTTELEEGVMPLLTAVVLASPLGLGAKRLPDASQTWDWAEAESALATCTGSLLVTELLAQHFTPQQRVTGLMRVLQALLTVTRPAAVHWPASQRVTDPDRFDPDGLDGVINVRFFTVGAEEAMLMDTLGLDLFELPDVQCHYRDFSPADVAAMLYDTAVYLFRSGDVIDDGHTISGPRGDEHFRCRHEDALVDPQRVVVDVDLGEPYAAGERYRPG